MNGGGSLAVNQGFGTQLKPIDPFRFSQAAKSSMHTSYNVSKGR